MDTRQYMIVDLERRGDKRMFITEQVSFISENKNGFWAVRFSTSPRVFNYNKSRLLYYTDPDTIDFSEKGLYIKNKHINNVAEVLRFSDTRHTFYRVTYTNGYYENFEGNDIYITRTPIEKNGGSTWEYLRKLADETGLMTEDEDNILSKQYELIDTMRDNVPLAQYLGNKSKLATYRLPKQVYYPFGCNASQKSAVEKALAHQVSIIQGPPGTGKTQTILNIIANLLVLGKTVLVVSNNNSAVENVAEKLESEGLGFIVAKLGRTKNKEVFIANQVGYPDMTDWNIEDKSTIYQLANDSLQSVSKGFDGQLRQAQLKTEYDALLKESKYNALLGTNNTDNKWLHGKPSSKLMTLLNLYRMMVEKEHKPGFWFRLKWSFAMGMKTFLFLNGKVTEVIAGLEEAYYFSHKAEIEQELSTIAHTLKSIDINRSVKDLRSSSLQMLKDKIAKRYGTGKRKRFSLRDIKPRTEEFLKEYPIILSTTYSAKSCISKDMVFDYVIMDETSQVDIKTGALALSCAMNAVIVGDDKQLPNVVNREEALALNAIQTTYSVDDRYNAVTHSFLQSCVEVFTEAPVTLLREHYRCHPKIIEFCNQRFYNGELVAMTNDNGEENVLQVVRTAKGNHAREHFNQREIDVITQEVMPKYKDMDSVGIITPYRNQAEETNKALPKESNLAQLITYIQYNNFEVKESKLHSVFDLLYKQYTAERLAHEATHPSVSNHLSENLVYEVLVKAIADLNLINAEVLCHYPLSRLIGDWSLLSEEEKAFAESPFSHVDFLIYNSLTKQPLQTIEVDGWNFHQKSDVQQSRDSLKDRLLRKFGLCPHRISTTETVNVETIKKIILISS